MSVEIISKVDSLDLATVRAHLQIDDDFTDDDTLIQVYSDVSLNYVENYTRKSWAVWNLSEVFAEWVNPLYIDWKQEVRAAQLEYTNTAAQTVTIDITIYAGNTIREAIADDYDGGSIKVYFTPYVDAHQKLIAQQARLLMIGDCYSHREDTITGTIVNALPNGIGRLLSTIEAGGL